jgi:acetyl esterase/lipase
MASKEYNLLLEQLKKTSCLNMLSLQEIRENFEKFLATFPPDPAIKFDTFSIKEKDWVRVDRLSSAARDYCKNEELTNPLISPLFGNLQGLPPLLIQVGASKILRDEAIAVAKKAEASGVSVTLEVWPEMVHCWQLFVSKVPEAQKAIDHIGTFIPQFKRDNS